MTQTEYHVKGWEYMLADLAYGMCYQSNYGHVSEIEAMNMDVRANAEDEYGDKFNTILFTAQDLRDIRHTDEPKPLSPSSRNG